MTQATPQAPQPQPPDSPRIPDSYRKVFFRGILPPQPDGSVAFSLNVMPEGPDGRFSEVIRVRLDFASALNLRDALRDTIYDFAKRSQSPKSSGMPSSAVSTPAEMESV